MLKAAIKKIIIPQAYFKHPDTYFIIPFITTLQTEAIRILWAEGKILRVSDVKIQEKYIFFSIYFDLKTFPTELLLRTT